LHRPGPYAIRLSYRLFCHPINKEDPNHTQSGFTALDLAPLGLPADEPYQVHDLLTDARYIWHGPRNFVMLDPARVPAHVFRVRRRVHTERDFDYFD